MRTEKDSLGEMEVPDEVYYGVQTARAIENFPVSGLRAHPMFIVGYAMLKKAAAMANMELSQLDAVIGDLIIRATDEIIQGQHWDEFVVDVFQAGAGTSFNMNFNEVIANRALVLLGREKGDYEAISPNDHVNMAQSTNDTFPTAAHIGILIQSARMLKALEKLQESLETKGAAFRTIPKSGRTHLMDAVPMNLGDEFTAYAAAIGRAMARIQERQADLLELPIGGTAVGTGANSDPMFRETIVRLLSDYTPFDFRVANDSFELLQSRSQMVAFSGAIRELAVELSRIASDLRLLGSGPTTGLNEIQLPAVQPGSSIMPGKVNPVMAECLNMVCFQIMGNDTTVMMAGQSGQMDLNVFTPVMLYNITYSMEMLINYIPTFTEKCIDGIQPNRDVCGNYLAKNPSMATLLNPRIGYLAAAEVAKEAFERGMGVSELAVEKGILTQEEADELFDPYKATRKSWDP